MAKGKRIVYQVLRCACGSSKCNKPVAEYFVSADYPKGAVLITPRHGKDKHPSILDLTKPSERPKPCGRTRAESFLQTCRELAKNGRLAV